MAQAQKAEAPFARTQAPLTLHALLAAFYHCSLSFRKASCLAQAQRRAAGLELWVTVECKYQLREPQRLGRNKGGGRPTRKMPSSFLPKAFLQTPPGTSGVADLHIRYGSLKHPSAPHITHSVLLPGMSGR